MIRTWKYWCQDMTIITCKCLLCQPKVLSGEVSITKSSDSCVWLIPCGPQLRIVCYHVSREGNNGTSLRANGQSACIDFTFYILFFLKITFISNYSLLIHLFYSTGMAIKINWLTWRVRRLTTLTWRVTRMSYFKEPTTMTMMVGRKKERRAKVAGTHDSRRKFRPSDITGRSRRRHGS